MTKTIEFYVENRYGVRREYIKDPAIARIVTGLTKQITIDGRIRELVRDLTGNLTGEQIKFVQVLLPNN